MSGGASSAAAFARSIALLALLVIGLPWLLVVATRERFGGALPLHGVPGPAAWELDRIRGALADRLTDDTIADVVIRIALVVAWVAITVVVATVVAEVAHMVRHHGLPMPDVRGLGPAQSIARVIAAGLLIIAPILTSPGASARDGTVLVSLDRAVSATTADGHEVARPDQLWPTSTTPDDTATDAPVAGQDGGTRADVSAATSTYVVQPGDSVYAIAARVAGPDGRAVAAYAEELLDLNIGRRMPDGQHFTNAAYIEVGWELELPGASTAAEGIARDAHVVERGESLWSIADDHLGDSTRWPEIYEVNEGRTFGDGRTLADPDLIHPGWELELPGDDRLSTADGQSDDVHDVATADEEVDVGSVVASDAAIDLPALTPPTERAPADADRAPSRPDQVWEARQLGSAESGTVSGDRTVDHGAVGAVGDAGGDDDDRADVTPLVALGGAAMLSSGVLTLLAVRRRSLMRRAQPRASLPTPASGPAATERTLRAIDIGDQFERVEVAIAASADALIAAGTRVVAVVVAADGAVELVASGPADLTAPWSQGVGPDRWHLPASAPAELLLDRAAAVPPPCPTLVQLGVDGDGRDVYVDLEALGAVEVGGPADAAESIVAALAVTLAASVRAEVVTMVGLGVPDIAFLGHRHHRPVRDAQRAFEAAADAIGSTVSASGSTFELRVRATGGEAWEPAVVLVGATAGTIVLPTNRMGLAVVSASPIHGPSSRLAPDGDDWVLRPVGLRCTPVGLRPNDVAAVAALVDVPEATGAPEGAPGGADATILRSDRDDFLGDGCDDELRADVDDRHGASDLPDWALLVRLLGPVDVVDRSGTPVVFERSKTRELVAWLATHRERSTRSAARTALWELDVRDATFNNVVSEARRALARLVDPPDDDEWVARTLTDALPLHPGVRTDADVLAAALAAARLEPPDRATATLGPAVELLRGMPFEGTAYLWPDAEGLTSELVLLATSAAAELAAHCLSVGDVEGVFDATRRGLQVLPGHEELIGLRMRACARAGDHAGVRHEWESYERVITADPWSDGEPSPKLVELRRDLLGSGR